MNIKNCAEWCMISV